MQAGKYAYLPAAGKHAGLPAAGGRKSDGPRAGRPVKRPLLRPAAPIQTLFRGGHTLKPAAGKTGLRALYACLRQAAGGP